MTAKMKRRDFMTLLGGAAAWPLAARAQQGAMPVVGFLRDATAAGSEFMVNGLRKGLAEAGFVEGHNLTIDYAWSEGQDMGNANRDESMPCAGNPASAAALASKGYFG